MEIAKSQHALSIGRVSSNELQNEKQIGQAYLFEDGGRDYYKIKIWQFGSNDYYLSKNLNGDNYTIFKRIDFDDEGLPVFNCPLGYAYLSMGLKNFIQLQFNFPWQKCFLSLHPENKGGY